MSKPEKQKESHNERFLKAVGEAQINASTIFEPAHQAVLREAQADHTGRLRGRSAGSVWQQLGGTMGTDKLIQGDTKGQTLFEGLATGGLGSALRDGTLKGTQLKDNLIEAGASRRLSNAKASGQSLAQSARIQDSVTANKIKLANDWKNEVTGAAFTLASMGAGMAKNEYDAGQEFAKSHSGLDGMADADKKNWFFRRGYNVGLGG